MSGCNENETGTTETAKKIDPPEGPSNKRRRLNEAREMRRDSTTEGLGMNKRPKCPAPLSLRRPNNLLILLSFFLFPPLPPPSSHSASSHFPLSPRSSLPLFFTSYPLSTHPSLAE